MIDVSLEKQKLERITDLILNLDNCVVSDTTGLCYAQEFARQLKDGIQNFDENEELYPYSDDDIVRLQDVNKGIIVKQAGKEDLKKALTKWNIPETEDNYRLFSKINLLESLRHNDTFEEMQEKQPLSCDITTEKGDIWDYPTECKLICVTKDLSMGAGLAKEFKNKYKSSMNMASLHFGDKNAVYVNEYNSIYSTKENRCHFILLGTKETAKEKADYKNLVKALKDARQIIRDKKLTNIIIPHIGCGHDKLDWNVVKFLIADTFSEDNIQIRLIQK